MERKASFTRMVDLRSVGKSVCTYVLKHLTALRIKLSHRRAIQILSEGLNIWFNLGHEEDIITRMLTTLMITAPIVVGLVIPIISFVLSAFSPTVTLLAISEALPKAAMISLICLGLMTVRIFIEWARYYRTSSNHHSMT